MGGVEQAIVVGAYWLVAVAAVASLIWVWHDDHRWLDRRRY
jgi:hypothetical protein